MSVSRTANSSRSRSASAQSAKLAFRIGPRGLGPRLGGRGALVGYLQVLCFPGGEGLVACVAGGLDEGLGLGAARPISPVPVPDPNPVAARAVATRENT